MDLFRRILRYLFSSVYLAVVTVVGVPVVLVLTVLAGLVFLPLPATIPIPRANPVVEPTTIYDRDGHVIATLAQYNQNVPVAESAIDQTIKEAVVSDEDRNFFKESGIDIRGTIRAAVADIRNDKAVQGGSTITQQYVKLAFTNGQRNLFRKVREAILASQLDRVASKDQILYRYLSIIYLGDGNTGIGAAAQNYFHTSVSDLNASQSATLAGLIPAPSSRAPREHLALAEQFRQLVLGKMLAQGYLTPASYQKAMAAHLALAGSKAPKGATIIYPQATTKTAYPDFVDYVTRWLLQRYPKSMVYGGGLRVQTTLDPAVQAAAYAAVRHTMSGTVPTLQMGLAAVEPETGEVEALVGGRDFGGTGPDAQDNFALGGCPNPGVPLSQIQVPATCFSGNTIGGGLTGRQPGSSWKPFVLATAFEQGIPPTRTFAAPSALPIPGCKVNGATCEIHNDEGCTSCAAENLATAMAQSTNTVYAQLSPIVGCPNVARTAKALGITSAYYSSTTIPFCQTYALGVVGVSPLDMASAYGVFDNHGVRAAPTPILEILNGAGKTLVDNLAHPPATTKVLPANVANNVTNVLQGVIKDGTGTAAALGRPAAGKTGTTSNYTDAWFVGYTPTLSAAVWMGQGDSEKESIGEVHGVADVFGGTFPAETWHSFMAAALQGVPATPFSAPAPILPPAKALTPSGPTTVPPLQPGAPLVTDGTPVGGPYVEQPPTPIAPLPPAPATTTTTTLPEDTTSTSATTSTTTAAGTGPPTGVP